MATDLLIRLVRDCMAHNQYSFRHNILQEMGGKLSFALTLLDGNNNGYIINSMHSREGCYNYIKEIVKGESYIELSEEEAESLDRAIFQEALGL